MRTREGRKKKKLPREKKAPFFSPYLEQRQPRAHHPGADASPSSALHQLGGYGGVAVGAGPELGERDLEGLVLLNAVVEVLIFWVFFWKRLRRDEERKRKKSASRSLSHFACARGEFSSAFKPLPSRSFESRHLKRASEAGRRAKRTEVATGEAQCEKLETTKTAAAFRSFANDNCLFAFSLMFLLTSNPACRERGRPLPGAPSV